MCIRDSKKDTCKAENRTCGIQNNGHTCQDSHHKLLHGIQHAYLNHMEVAVNCMLSDQPVLLPMQKVSLSEDIETTIFYDGGSNASIITHTLANQLKLTGRPISIYVRYASKDPEWLHTQLYTMNITTNDREKLTILLIQYWSDKSVGQL